MKYNLDKLNHVDFEGLVQSLCRKVLGYGTIDFAEGTDGGREASLIGKAPFPTENEQWTGYWVIQAKFKTGGIDDFTWIKNQLTSELEKYATRKVDVAYPNNYLLFTNAKLSAKPKTGGRDKATDLEKAYQKKYKISNIRIISYDDIIRYLENNRDVAISYAPFILPGDVLFSLLELTHVKKDRIARINEVISRFLEYEFREDAQSKLDHAGKLTNEKVNLEKVFIDLNVANQGNSSAFSLKFINFIVDFSNRILRNQELTKYVLIAGPGQGKSTLTQFLSQIYRAFFLRDIDLCPNTIDGVADFISECQGITKVVPAWIRLPIKITLKEYAGWIRDIQSKTQSADISILHYIQYNIRRKGRDELSIEEIETLISTLPCLFIFDGLDEVPVSSNRAVVLSEIKVFSEIQIRRLNSDSVIICTSRPQGYSYEFEIGKYSHLKIADMEPNECEFYLGRLLENIIGNLDERLHKLSILRRALEDKVVSRIMRSPLQASIMAILVQSGGEPPTNKYDLFSEYFSTIFKREKQRGILPILSESPEYVMDIHDRLGLYLQAVSEKYANSSGNISGVEFKAIIRTYLLEIGHPSEDIETQTTAIWTATMDRLVFISHLEDEKVGFAIRSMQEYFAALGYIRNISDESVGTRLRKVCANAYWGNTLLFIIGFLSKDKKYLIDVVESICGELNGSLDDKHNTSLSSIPKMGSWLALDILNEAILRATPKMENKFLHLLAPLLKIPVIDKHQDFARLSANILDRGVLKLIESELQESPRNLTCWAVIAELVKAGHDLGVLIDLYWPEDQQLALKILQYFFEVAEINSIVVDKFPATIVEENKAELFLILSKADSQELFKLACQIVDTREQKAILFEILFLASIQAYRSIPYADLYKLMGVTLDEKFNNTRGHRGLYNELRKNISIRITNAYSFSIIPITPSSILELEPISLYANEHNVEFVIRFFEFTKRPSVATFQSLDKTINKFKAVYQDIVRNTLRWLNSFFYCLHSHSDDNDPVAVERLIDELEQIEKNPDVVTNTKFEFFHLLGLKRIDIGDLYEDFKQYIKLYLSSDKKNETALKEFRALIEWTIHNLTVADFRSLQSDKALLQVLEEALMLDWCRNEYSDLSGFVSIMTLFEVSKIKIFFEVYERSGRIKKSWKYEAFRGDMLEVLPELMVKKISELILLQLLLNENPYYKILIDSMIQMVELLNGLNGASIPFKAILEKGHVDPYVSAILLFDPQFNECHALLIEEIFDVHIHEFEVNGDIQQALMVSLRYAAPSHILDKTMVFIYNKMQNASINFRSSFTEFIKQYVETKPSDLDLNKLELIKS